MLLADLTPAKLIMGEIPRLLELGSEVHDILICG